MSKMSAYGQDTAPTPDDYVLTVDATSGTNKRVLFSSLRSIFAVRRVNTITSSSSPAPASDTTDFFTVTGLGGVAGTSITATFAAPSGTPTEGQVLIIRIKDNGTAQTLAWNAIYRAIGVTLPTATTPSKTMYVGMMYNSVDAAWDVISVGRQS